MQLLPRELVGYTLSFLDGRSLTSFEVVAASTRRLLREHPDMFKRLLVSILCVHLSPPSDQIATAHLEQLVKPNESLALFPCSLLFRACSARCD